MWAVAKKEAGRGREEEVEEEKVVTGESVI